MPDLKSFSSVKQFVTALRSQNSGYKDVAKDQQKRRTLLSMAPSGMQSEATMKGFHILRFDFTDQVELSAVTVEHHQYLNKQYTSSARQFVMIPSS
jgi:hypothetical protein